MWSAQHLAQSRSSCSVEPKKGGGSTVEHSTLAMAKKIDFPVGTVQGTVSVVTSSRAKVEDLSRLPLRAEVPWSRERVHRHRGGDGKEPLEPLRAPTTVAVALGVCVRREHPGLGPGLPATQTLARPRVRSAAPSAKAPL